MSKKEKIVSVGLVLTAFLLLGTSLHLTYKQSALPASAKLSANGKSFTLEESRQYLKSFDYNKASKQKGGAPLDVLKKAMSQFMKTGIPNCFQGVGNIKVPHSMCIPAGPPPKGKDGIMCPVFNVEGGSVTAICMAGCCRQVSATGSAEATQGLPPGFGGLLGQTLGQLLGKLMSGGGSGAGSSGSYVPTIQRDTTPSILNTTTDIDDQSIAVNNLSGEDYLPNYASNESDYIYSEQESDLNAENRETVISNDSISTDILSIDEENYENNQGKTQNSPGGKTVKSLSVQKRNENYVLQDIDDAKIDGGSSRYLAFQDIRKEYPDNPELEKLRDPDEAFVRKYANKRAEEFVVKNEQSQTWWEWLLSLFGL